MRSYWCYKRLKLRILDKEIGEILWLKVIYVIVLSFILGKEWVYKF